MAHATDSDQLSVTASNTSEILDDPLQELTDEQLYRLLQETFRSNEVLEVETQMFDKFLKRVEQKDVLSGAYMSSGQSPNSQINESPSNRVARRRSKSRSSTMDKSMRLTAEQKCDIAQREIEELRDEIDKLTEESQKIIDTYKDTMEEADIRQAECKKESYEFERDIVKGAVNPRTNIVVAEKVTRYFDDKLRTRDTLIEKLRLKNATLKVQKKKLLLQLKQKEEMGEVLHEVDFNQLKIENQQYLEKIDERNQDLLRLKLMAGSTLQVLNSYKKKLHILTKEAKRLHTETVSRNDLLGKIAVETELVEKERIQAEIINKRLRVQLTDFKVPEVMEYVNEKAELYELQKKLKTWERKVEISEMALKTHRKTWNILQIQNQRLIADC